MAWVIYRITAMLGVVLMVVGCQVQSGPVTYPVSGMVTYQGKPLEKGRISFIPDTKEIGSGPTCACEIIAGKFDGKSTAGVKKIEIYGSWKTGRMMTMDDGSGQVAEIASIPGKYNELSQIKVELLPQANAGLAFDLQ
ncbi:hypothetical protein [Blastopirellula marina]|uniref:Lipoprotein n=1 Tax=Blastopirellula marina DSM 3645 TaxID=314230 RepID=A3ZMN9_9BACT|nr:hypothetical protein [Blastopirellula marina]EAQ82212.1 hypothetical protein DSM3645_00820 [Blastopirellula marina DSM 3645]